MSEQDQKACAYLNAAVARASIRAMGMQARNAQCEISNQRPMYMEEEFMAVILQEGIGYNDVQSVLYGK